MHGPLLLLFACGGAPTDTSGDSPIAPPPDDSAEVETDDTSPPVDAPIALVSDGANERLVMIRLDTQEVFFELDLNTYRPSSCEGETLECVLYSVEHDLDDATGDDLLLLTYSRVRVQGDTSENLGSIIERVRINDEGTELDWSLEALDFLSQFAGNTELCDQPAPCVAPTGEGEERWRNCSLSGVHDVEIAAEDDTSITLWAADTGRRSRVLEITLDKGSTCGVVTEALAPATLDLWDIYENTNDVDRIELDGETVIMATHKGTNPIYGGQVGQGRVTFWLEVEDQWTRIREMPADGGFLNAPHNADRIVEGDQDYLLYAHSNGRGQNRERDGFDMETDHYGSVGVARLDDDGLVYLFDGYLAGDAPLNFIRDVDRLSDGSLFVTDSGCNDNVHVDCTRAPGLRHLSLDLEAAAGEGSGAWEEGYVEQTFVELQELNALFPSPLDCDFEIPYEADLLWSDELGPSLRALLDGGEVVRSCAP